MNILLVSLFLLTMRRLLLVAQQVIIVKIPPGSWILRRRDEKEAGHSSTSTPESPHLHTVLGTLVQQSPLSSFQDVRILTPQSGT